jgi:hypothetical protein
MTGRSDADIAADIAQARSLLEQRRYPMEIITPLEIKEKVDLMYAQYYVASAQPDYEEYLCQDIYQIIKECDAVCFCRGWRHSRGCRLEMAAAKIFEKAIIYCK